MLSVNVSLGRGSGGALSLRKVLIGLFAGVLAFGASAQSAAPMADASASLPVNAAGGPQAAPKAKAEIPASVRALDGQLILAQGQGNIVRLQDLREAAAEFVSAGEQERFWYSPAVMSEMVSSLYRQQVLAGKARAAGLALPSSASSLTEVQANRELANVYLQQEAQKRMPTAAAVERYAKAQYTQNSSGYEHGEMFRVSHILVTVKEGVRTEAQARERAQSVIDRLAKGEDFGALAAEFSDDQGSRHEKGSLNYREAKELPEDFVSVLQSMAVGSRSVEPMRTKAGYHVIWLQEKRPAGRLSFDDMRDQLMTQASAQLATRATRTVWDEALTGFTLNTAHLDQVVAAMRGAR